MHRNIIQWLFPRNKNKVEKKCNYNFPNWEICVFHWLIIPFHCVQPTPFEEIIISATFSFHTPLHMRYSTAQHTSDTHPQTLSNCKLEFDYIYESRAKTFSNCLVGSFAFRFFIHSDLSGAKFSSNKFHRLSTLSLCSLQ